MVFDSLFKFNKKPNYNQIKTICLNFLWNKFLMGYHKIFNSYFT